MDEGEAGDLYADILKAVERFAPWAAAQIRESAREGRPVAKEFRTNSSSREAQIVALRPATLRKDQFAATVELSQSERLRLALDALERLLVDPSEIREQTEGVFATLGISKMVFAQPDSEAPSDGTTEGAPQVVALFELMVALQFLFGFYFLNREPQFPSAKDQRIGCLVRRKDLGPSVYASSVRVPRVGDHDVITFAEAAIAMRGESSPVRQTVDLL